jgi:serine/threonine protein kinase
MEELVVSILQSLHDDIVGQKVYVISRDSSFFSSFLAKYTIHKSIQDFFDTLDETEKHRLWQFVRGFTSNPFTHIGNQEIIKLGSGVYNSLISVFNLQPDWAISFPILKPKHYVPSDRLKESADAGTTQWCIIEDVNMFHMLISDVMCLFYDYHITPHCLSTSHVVLDSKYLRLMQRIKTSKSEFCYNLSKMLNRFAVDRSWNCHGQNPIMNPSLFIDELFWQICHTLFLANKICRFSHLDLSTSNVLFDTSDSSIEWMDTASVQHLQYVIQDLGENKYVSYTIPFRRFLFKLADFDLSSVSWENEVGGQTYCVGPLTYTFFYEKEIGYRSPNISDISIDIVYLFWSLGFITLTHPLWDTFMSADDLVRECVVAQIMHVYLAWYVENPPPDVKGKGSYREKNNYEAYIKSRDALETRLVLHHPKRNTTLDANTWFTEARRCIIRIDPFRPDFCPEVHTLFSFQDIVTRYRRIHSESFCEYIPGEDDPTRLTIGTPERVHRLQTVLNRVFNPC